MNFYLISLSYVILYKFLYAYKNDITQLITSTLNPLH